MIHDAFLDLFEETKRLNVHPSLVPQYRGPAPIQHAIADGREVTGVSILEMKYAKLGADVGEVWAKKALVRHLTFHFSDSFFFLGFAVFRTSSLMGKGLTRVLFCSLFLRTSNLRS